MNTLNYQTKYRNYFEYIGTHMTSEVMFRRGDRPTILKYIIKASDIVGQVYSPIMLLAQINMFPYFF